MGEDTDCIKLKLNKMAKHTCNLLSRRLLQISSNKLEQMLTILAMVLSLAAKEFRKLIRKNALEILDLGAEGFRR
jgi:hypothetical protein